MGKKNKNIELITFKQDKKGITINIPKDLLKFVAENHPEYPLKINNIDVFQNQIMVQLESNMINQHTGLTKFQELLDNACYEVADNGHESVEFIEF